MREVADALKTLPRIFLDLVLPRLPGLNAGLREGSTRIAALRELLDCSVEGKNSLDECT